MTIDADLATLRGFSGPDLAPGYDAALDRLEAKVATLRKERDAARKQSREASEMYVRANEQITELLQQQSFMERKLVAQREDIERLAERVMAAEANADPDYSPEYQDEYQRLWHKESARAEAAEEREELALIAVGKRQEQLDAAEARCAHLQDANDRLLSEKARLQQALAGLESAVRILDVMLREPAAEGLMSAEDYRSYVQGAWLGVDEAATMAREALGSDSPSRFEEARDA